jgi:hypothetical protein
MKCFAMAFLCSLFFSVNALAGNFTGIWWNQSEAGWGVNFSQQGDVIFAAMYVYDPSGRPTWYSSSMRATATAPGTFSGDLSATTGPYFGGVFNPAAVAARKVGTMSFNAPSFNRGTLSYRVDGISVTKTIDQFAFAAAPIQGTYAITIVRDPGNSCVIPNFATNVPTRLAITGNQLQLQSSTGAVLCNAPGVGFQAGATYGFVADSASCLPGARLTIADLKAEGIAGLTNANVLLTAAYIFEGTNPVCTSIFFVAGVRIL